MFRYNLRVNKAEIPHQYKNVDVVGFTFRKGELGFIYRNKRMIAVSEKGKPVTDGFLYEIVKYVNDNQLSDSLVKIHKREFNYNRVRNLGTMNIENSTIGSLVDILEASQLENLIIFRTGQVHRNPAILDTTYEVCLYTKETSDIFHIKTIYDKDNGITKLYMTKRRK